MLSWLKRVITGRGKGPSRNRAHAREVRIEQEVEALLDAWRVAQSRGEALIQLERFRAMARGEDGGRAREGHADSVRRMHYPKWRDRDFAELVARLEAAIGEAAAREAAAQAILEEEG